MLKASVLQIVVVHLALAEGLMKTSSVIRGGRFEYVLQCTIVPSWKFRWQLLSPQTSAPGDGRNVVAEHVEGKLPGAEVIVGLGPTPPTEVEGRLLTVGPERVEVAYVVRMV